MTFLVRLTIVALLIPLSVLKRQWDKVYVTEVQKIVALLIPLSVLKLKKKAPIYRSWHIVALLIPLSVLKLDYPAELSINQIAIVALLIPLSVLKLGYLQQTI